MGTWSLVFFWRFRLFSLLALRWFKGRSGSEKSAKDYKENNAESKLLRTMPVVRLWEASLWWSSP